MSPDTIRFKSVRNYTEAWHARALASEQPGLFYFLACLEIPELNAWNGERSFVLNGRTIEIPLDCYRVKDPE